MSEQVRNGMFIWFLSIPPQNIYSLQREKSDFTVEKPGRHHLFQVIKVNSTSNSCATQKDAVRTL